MGSALLSKTENDHLRTLCKRAVASGDYSSYNNLGERAGIGGTTLYPIMNKGGGFSTRNAEKLMPFLKKYDRPRRERASDPLGLRIDFGNGTSLSMNGRGNGLPKTNGRANGKRNGHSNGHTPRDEKRSKAVLTKDVLLKLFELRERTADAEIRTRIDETIDNWALDGLHILSSTAERVYPSTMH